MSDKTVASTSSNKGRRWLRRLVWFAAIVVVLLIAVYFVATSSAFIKGVILPRAGTALNADIMAGDVALHPFSGLDLRDLQVTAKGQKPLLTAAEIRVRYHLLDILGGNIHVDEIALVSPHIQLIQNADGTSNLGPILQALQAKPAAQPAAATATKAAKPLQLDLGKLTVSDATIWQVKNHADGRSDVAGVTNVNVTLTNLKNGQTAKLELSADLQMENQSTNAAGTLAAVLKGAFNCTLTPDLKPGPASGQLNFTVARAGGVFGDADAFGAALDCDITPTEVKQVALHLQKAGAPLGELTVSGPLDLNQLEGKLSVAVRGIDHRLLNLAGARSGLDFGTTTIDATNEIQLASAGAVITAAGRLDVAKVRLTRAGQTTPTLDLNAAYDVTVDRAKQTATVRVLNFSGTQNNAPLLRVQLASPMSLAWGGGAGDVGDAALDVAVTGLNLADWKPFLGPAVDAGQVGMKLKVVSHQGGKEIQFDLNTDVAGLAVRVGSNVLSQAGITLAAHGQATQFKQVTLSDYQLNITLQQQPALAVAGAAHYDLATGDADAQVKLQAALAHLLQALPQPGMNVSSGDVGLNVQVAQKQKVQSFAGDLTLTNFSAQISGKTLQGLGGRIQFDVTNSPAQIQINQLQLALTPTARATNQINLSGQVDLTQKEAIQGTLKVVADSLDLTSYYDQFTGGTNAAAKAAATPAPKAATTPAQAGPEPEPAAVKLPLRNFVLGLEIGRLYLHEVAITNWETTVKIEGGHVVVKPFRLALNGAPVNATVDADLSVPGYKYDVGFSAQQVPLAPLVDTFQPARAGQLGGTLVADMQIAGAGVTGASLQKNLAGKFDLDMTNLNLSVMNVKSSLLKSVINVVATIPELISSPENALASLLGGVTGQGGLMNELQQSPINTIATRVTAGHGKVNLQSATVQSPAFEADASGEIGLNAVLTNSTLNFPVNVALSQAIAKKLNMTATNNAAYVALPQFLTMTGTLGNAKANINKLALAGAAVHSLSGGLLNTSNAVPAVNNLLNKFLPKK